MSAARRLARLERMAPPPAPDASAGGAPDASAARILALFNGAPLPDGPPVTEAEHRAARILAVMAAAPAGDNADDAGERGS